jgi:hypothetical protein
MSWERGVTCHHADPWSLGWGQRQGPGLSSSDPCWEVIWGAEVLQMTLLTLLSSQPLGLGTNKGIPKN